MSVQTSMYDTKSFDNGFWHTIRSTPPFTTPRVASQPPSFWVVTTHLFPPRGLHTHHLNVLKYPRIPDHQPGVPYPHGVGVGKHSLTAYAMLGLLLPCPSVVPLRVPTSDTVWTPARLPPSRSRSPATLTALVLPCPSVLCSCDCDGPPNVAR